MKPPWVALPQIPPGSVGWRMGSGEEYWMSFNRWYQRLAPAQREHFELDNPEPEGWRGFYSRKKAPPKG